MEQIVIYLWMVQKLLNSRILKIVNSEIVLSPLCLGNISRDWSVDNMKKTGFTMIYVYDLISVDYDSTDVDDIFDIHKYLMKKNNIV